MKKKRSHSKRKPAQDFDRAQPIPLKQVINFGPVTLAEFESMGIVTLDQLESLGLEEAARLWIEYYPERLNANAFLGLIATLDGNSWVKATAAQRSRAKALASFLKRELNPSKRQKI